MSIIGKMKEFYEKPPHTQSGLELTLRMIMSLLIGGLGGWAIIEAIVNPIYLVFALPVCIHLFNGKLDSDLKETYTIKFMDGDELRTVLLSSTDRRLHVHFTDDNKTMNLSVTCTDYDGYGRLCILYNNKASYNYPNDDDDASRDFMKYINEPVYSLWHDRYSEDTTENGFLYDFNLYIPRPEICQLSNGTVVP